MGKTNYLDNTIKCTQTENEVYMLKTMYAQNFETHSVQLLHAKRIRCTGLENDSAHDIKVNTHGIKLIRWVTKLDISA